jgi:hypothetical protein
MLVAWHSARSRRGMYREGLVSEGEVKTPGTFSTLRNLCRDYQIGSVIIAYLTLIS